MLSKRRSSVKSEPAANQISLPTPPIEPTQDFCDQTPGESNDLSQELETIDTVSTLGDFSFLQDFEASRETMKPVSGHKGCAEPNIHLSAASLSKLNSLNDDDAQHGEKGSIQMARFLSEDENRPIHERLLDIALAGK